MAPRSTFAGAWAWGRAGCWPWRKSLLGRFPGPRRRSRAGTRGSRPGFVAPCAVLLLSVKAHLKPSLGAHAEQGDDSGPRGHDRDLAAQDRGDEGVLLGFGQLCDVLAALQVVLF